jgi:hypothetical protein
MSNLQEIEQAIERLPRSEVFALGEWLAARINAEWDEQFESDVHGGRLDEAARRAIEPGNLGTTGVANSKAVDSFWQGYHR